MIFISMQICKFYYDFYFKITKTTFKYSLKQTEYNKQHCHVKEQREKLSFADLG